MTISSRQSRRGGALAISMLFFVLVTIAGTAMLSISGYHRIQTVRNGIDVRLMIAAEAGIESVRGRFTIVQDTQEDWAALLPTTGWNPIGNFTINGIPVTVEAQPFGAPSVPTARIRSTATSGTKSRTVEYMIKVATFSDYSVFNAGGGSNTLGENYKGAGNLYFGGDVNIPNTGAQIFGSSYMIGEVEQGYGPGNNSDTGQAWTYHFPVEPPAENQPVIPIPTWASPWDSLEDQANLVGHRWAENTLAIELRGAQYRRYFVRRTLSTGGTPSGTNWLNLNSSLTSTTFGPAQRLVTTASSITANSNYELTFLDYDIPDEGVIYVKTGDSASVAPSILGVPAGDDVVSGTNSWTQSVPAASSGDWGGNGTGATIAGLSGTDYDIVQINNGTGNTNDYAKVLLLWGVIDDRRVSIACDHKIVLADCIAYQEVLNIPNYRNFWGDGKNGKQSPGALGFKEMLGVMSRQDCHLTPTWWRRLPTLNSASDQTGELVPGHTPTNSFSMDGVFFAVRDTRPWRHRNNLQGEFWGHGGLIAGNSYAAGMGNHFARRNYDWDYRLALTTPPYFLRAYNASAVFLPGTWRTYD